MIDSSAHLGIGLPQRGVGSGPIGWHRDFAEARNRLRRPALERAGVPDLRENGCHALRHFLASTALHEGETIKAVSEYLGHADPGFTLRTYTHLMEGSSERTRRAIATAFLGEDEEGDE